MTTTITNTSAPAARTIRRATTFLIGVAVAGALAFGLAAPAMAAQSSAANTSANVVTHLVAQSLPAVKMAVPVSAGRVGTAAKPPAASVQGYRGP